jgi:hypothetical protein
MPSGAAAMIKTVDSKGRVTLGDKFANRTVIIDEVDDTEVRVTLARVMPEREAWLYKNDKALDLVGRGLDEARQGQFADAPDMDKARKLADSIPDEE